MEESSCLIHSFDNYSSTLSSEANRGNYAPAPGESISFGRFKSESLSWEKWSTFSHKRYVEEAERYAQPGSVAQKKAFFEAHYKKIAAKKAAEEEAALREKELALNANLEPESENESCVTSVHVFESLELDPIVNEGDVAKDDDKIEKLGKNEDPNQEMAEMEKPLLKDFKATSPSSNVFVQRKTQKVPVPPPVKNIFPSHHRKENSAAPISRRTLSESFIGNRSYRKTVPSIPISPVRNAVLVPNNKKENNGRSAVSTPTTNISAKPFDGNRSARKTVPKIPISPARNAVSIPNKKENNATPRIRMTLAETIYQNRRTPNLLPKIPVSPAKLAASVNLIKETNSTRKKWESPVVSTSMKKSAMRSLRTLIYSTPGKESDKTTLPSASRVAPSSSKASKTCETPSRTQLMGFAKGESKNTAATPASENRRTITSQEAPQSGGKATRPKWHILSSVCSRPPSANKTKLQSPTLSAPFNLRTEERAARRKQKLEEKFNEKATPKVQLQTKIKEKAETELRKLRRSLCFRAKPLPDFYKEKEAPKDQLQDLKMPIAHPEAPKLGKKPIFTASKSIGSHYSSSDTQSTRNNDFKNVIQKAKGVPNLIIPSLPEKISCENTTPNIKH